MIIYIIVAICLILDMINPKILWYMDFWKYNGDKPEPSPAYLWLNRILAGIALLVLAVVFYSRKM